MNTVELFEAKERGEKIELLSYQGVWREWDGASWVDHWQFRIAPKQMTLVEELWSKQDKLCDRAAARIEELEKSEPIVAFSDRELLEELKRRMK